MENFFHLQEINGLELESSNKLKIVLLFIEKWKGDDIRIR